MSIGFWHQLVSRENLGWPPNLTWFGSIITTVSLMTLPGVKWQKVICTVTVNRSAPWSPCCSPEIYKFTWEGLRSQYVTIESLGHGHNVPVCPGIGQPDIHPLLLEDIIGPVLDITSSQSETIPSPPLPLMEVTIKQEHSLNIV